VKRNAVKSVREFCFSLPSEKELLALLDATRRRDARSALAILAKFYGVEAPPVIIDPDRIYKSYSATFMNTRAVYFHPSREYPVGLIALKSPDGCTPFVIGHEWMHHFACQLGINVCEGVCDLFGNALSVACYNNPLHVARHWRRSLSKLEFIESPRTVQEIVARFGRFPYVLRSDISQRLVKRTRLGKHVRLELNGFGRQVLEVLRSESVN